MLLYNKYKRVKTKKMSQSHTCLAGENVSKSIPVLGVIGELDELNCCLGLAKAFSGNAKLKSQIAKIQKDLMAVSGLLAGAVKEIRLEKKVTDLEKQINQIKSNQLKEFLIPGKNKTSTFLHLARAVCRRAERNLVSLSRLDLQEAVNYLNRLSGLLFWLAVEEGED